MQILSKAEKINSKRLQKSFVFYLGESTFVFVCRNADIKNNHGDRMQLPEFQKKNRVSKNVDIRYAYMSRISGAIFCLLMK